MDFDSAASASAGPDANRPPHSRVGGALYVLKGESYIRISVGGAGDQAQKLEKSKTLAAFVLKRL